VSEKTNALEYIQKTAEESIQIKRRFVEEGAETLVAATAAMAESIHSGGKILIFGNGGSAADSQHMAAEMIGRMLIERRPLPAIALTTDTSGLTAVGNDYGYDLVFQKQVQGLCKKEDIVIAISTSGNSKNVLLGVESAKKLGAKVIGVTGGEGGELGRVADFHLNTSLSQNSSRAQETHIFIIHSLVDLLDRFYLKG
tara:strand:- start:40 stop:633 length:594 start_codon:yes stop_codon:yes gene_type:complete